MENSIKYKIIFWGLIFLFLGLTASPTIVAGYHILIFIPTFLLMSEGYRLKLPKSSVFLVGLIVWGLIATLVNHATLVNPIKSYQELKYYFFAIFSIITLSYFFRDAPKKHIKLLLNLLLTAIVIGFFVGIARSKFEFDPVKWVSVPGKYHTRVGGFTNYMRYGYSSALMFILGCGVWFNLKSLSDYISRRWLGVFLTFNLLAVIFSETRGATLALVVGISFLLLKYRPKIGRTLLGLGITGVLAIALISISKGSKNRYLNINDGSNKIRLSQFYSAFKSIEERPIFGLGADQFSYNVKDIKQRHDIWSKDYSGHSHNIILEHTVNYGIPGGLLFISFLIFWFIELVRARNDLGWIIASYLVGFVIGGQVELLFDVINSHLIFFLYAYSQMSHVYIKKIS